MSDHKTIIRGLYEAEEAQDMAEREDVKFTASADITDLALIDAIASRFKTTRTSLVRDSLHYAAMKLFIELREQDKTTVGKQADDSIVEHMEKAYDNFSISGGTWSSLAKIYNKEDAKDADS